MRTYFRPALHLHIRLQFGRTALSYLELARPSHPLPWIAGGEQLWHSPHLGALGAVWQQEVPHQGKIPVTFSVLINLVHTSVATEILV